MHAIITQDISPCITRVANDIMYWELIRLLDASGLPYIKRKVSWGCEQIEIIGHDMDITLQVIFDEPNY